MFYKLAPFILLPTSNTKSLAEIYISKPSDHEEKIAGKIFIIVEIDSRKTDDIRVINFLIENLENFYYQNEKLLLKEKLESVTIEHIFEASLAKMNKSLLEFLYSNKIKFNPKLFNAIIGVIANNEIHFASVGKNKALLLYNDKKEKKYKAADIMEHAQGESHQVRQVNLAKIFSNVISGKIPRGGYFVFSNEATPEYLSAKQLIEIVTTLPPTGAAEQIKQTLTKINNHVSFIGLIVKNMDGVAEELSQNKIAVTREENKLSQNLTHLDYLERNTEKVMIPKGLISPRIGMRFAQDGITKLKEKINKNNFKFLRLSNSNQFGASWQKKASSQTLGKAKVLSKDFLTIVLNGIRSLVLNSIKLINQTIEKIGSKKNNIATIPSTSPSQIIAGQNYLQKLIAFFAPVNGKFTGKQKIIFTFIIAVFTLLVLNTVYLKQKNIQQQVVETKNQTLEQIEQKQNQIDANLIYNNFSNAKKILDETKNLIGQLPNATEEEKQKTIEFENKYKEQLDKIRNVTAINNPETLLNLENIDAGFTNLSLAGEKIYLSNGSSLKITQINTKTGESKNLTNFNASSTTLSYLKYPAQTDGGAIYYLAGAKNIIKVDSVKEEIRSLDISLSANIDNVSAATGYGNRIYYLIQGNNQIYRHDIGKQIGTGKPWLTETADLNGAIDMKIDGSIYILKGKGEVLKFTQGKNETFNLEPIEPELQFASHLVLPEDGDSLYILDPVEKRIAVFTKNGQFIRQYQLNNINKVNDLAVDEKNKTIYTLTDQAVIKFAITEEKK